MPRELLQQVQILKRASTFCVRLLIAKKSAVNTPEICALEGFLWLQPQIYGYNSPVSINREHTLRDDYCSFVYINIIQNLHSDGSAHYSPTQRVLATWHFVIVLILKCFLV